MEYNRSSHTELSERKNTEDLLDSPALNESKSDDNDSKVCLVTEKMSSKSCYLSGSSCSDSSFSDEDYGIPKYTIKNTELCTLPLLHQAVWINNVTETISICTGNSQLINITDNQNRTALHLACAKGLVDIIRYLCRHLKWIMDVNIKDIEGCTPIYKLIEFGYCYSHSRSLEYLMDCGGDPNLANNMGETPLHYAASTGDDLTTQFLIFKGVSVNVINKNGQTPLHLATINDHKKVIAVLITSGADVTIQDNSGRTPLILAYNDKTLVEYICDLYTDQNLTKGSAQSTMENVLYEDDKYLNHQCNSDYQIGEKYNEREGHAKSFDSVTTSSIVPCTDEDEKSLHVSNISIANSNAITVKTSTHPECDTFYHKDIDIAANNTSYTTPLQLSDSDHNEVTCKKKANKIKIEDAIHLPSNIDESDKEKKSDNDFTSNMTPFNVTHTSGMIIPSNLESRILIHEDTNTANIKVTLQPPDDLEEIPADSDKKCITLCHESTNTANIKITITP